MAAQEFIISFYSYVYVTFSKIKLLEVIVTNVIIEERDYEVHVYSYQFVAKSAII